ncbi:MAG: hypothetical protein AAGA80_02910 [Cyanobacteria bacterium P01_F01_bin.143]
MIFFNTLYGNLILGTLGHDALFGSDGLDYILGLAGNDTLNGRENHDLILGGNGDDSLIGEAGSDFLFGGHGNDTLDGGDDDDHLYGGNGFDTIFGFAGNDILNGGTGDDSLNGGDGNDTFQSSASIENTNFLNVNLDMMNIVSTNLHHVHSQMHGVFSSIDLLLTLHHGDSRLGNSQIFNANVGNDTLDGGDGYDTADYTDLGQAVTLTPTGIVEKANGQSDLLIDIEKVIGAAEQENKIDASTAGNTATLDVDLAANRLNANGLPELVATRFEVENFRHVSGTNQEDILRGDSHDNILEGNDGNDFIHGGFGNDSLDGGDGYDTVDYISFNQAITITPTGIVEKANGQSDLLVDVEKIIGAIGQDNKIDAITASGDSIYLDVDLSANRMTVKDIPGLGDLNFEMEHFRHVSGTNQSDKIIGNDHNNILEGHDGNDTLDGGDGYDTVDYTGFGQAVTITPAGTVEKANGKTDLLIDIEKIVGAVGQDNKIDSITAGDNISLDVDLSANRLIVKGIPELGALSFYVENFRHVSGTNQEDILSGDSHDNILEVHDGNDFIYAGLGNDSLDGGEGYDTVDYSIFDQAITITPAGIVEKANGQTDLLVDVEKIVGAAGKENKIDAITAGDDISLDVDLSEDRLIVNGIPGLGGLNFEIQHFRDVSGTNQSDRIIGNDHDNILEGHDGNDTLDGGEGYDIVDYTGFGQVVTMTPTGIMEKANGKTDLLVDVEKIIGAAGQENRIDAITASGDSIYLDVDLSENRMTVKDIPGLGDLNFEMEHFRHVSGTNQSDRIIGNDLNNILEGHDGNDTLDGGEGYDIVDYTGFGNAITVTPTGIVEKANGKTDLLIDIEEIVGAVGHNNKIDAISAGDDAYLDVDLSANRMTVEGIAELRDLNFEMEHFRDISGTNQDDIFRGDSHDNVLEGHDGYDIIYGGEGNDTLDGGDKFDTIDYTEFGEAITLTPVGVIEKANGQSDLLVDVERIVGAIAESNKIDASSAPGDTAYLDVDLSAEQIKIKNIPVLGEQDFQVVNFRHVSGTNQSDRIIGDSHDNILEGNGGDDTLIGSNQNYYSNEIDRLTGGSGADKFVLGDSVEAYYQGDSFAKITDFDSAEGDKLVAFGAVEDYTVSEFEGGTNVAYQGDLVAFVVNTTDVDLYSDFNFV